MFLHLYFVLQNLYTLVVRKGCKLADVSDDDLPIIVFRTALKHGFSEDEVRAAWKSALELESFVRVRFDKQPPHYMAIGYIGERKVELIASSDGFRWRVFHARLAYTGGFKIEYRESGGKL